MPAVIRKGMDASTSDPCGAPPRVPAAGSPNVFTNGAATVRLGDAYVAHACPGSPPHGASASGGSGTVFVNSKPVHRKGDSISCGSSANNGSPDVFAG